MTQAQQQALSVAGFAQPLYFQKPDPRGKEYGFFQVLLQDLNVFVVYHTKDDYELIIRGVENFEKWAKACT